MQDTYLPRIGDERMPKRVMSEEVSGQRSKGRLKQRWTNNIKKDVAEMRESSARQTLLLSKI